MRRIETFSAAFVVAISLSIMARPVARAAPFNRPDDVAKITAIERDVAGQTDIDKVIRYFAPNAVVADFATPGWYEGRKKIYAAYQPQLAAVKAIKFHIDDINVASDGKMACAAMQIKFDATEKDNSPVSMIMRELDAFKKIGGHWQFIQQHISLPVDEKTGRAVWNGPLPARGPLNWAADPFPGPAETPARAKKEIRTWLEAEALPTDADDATGFYGPGNSEMLFEVFYPGEHRGLKEIHDYFGPALAGVRNLQVKIPSFFAESDGEFGVQIDRQDLKIAMKDGTTQFMSFRQSDCMHRVGGKWYAFFEMGSFPVDAKTGKAIMANPAAFR